MNHLTTTRHQNRAGNLPLPPVPSDCDLRNFPFFPLDIDRLFESEFHSMASDAEWRAGVTLWPKSFHEVPAGSLPKDDRLLARLAELGQDVAKWRRVKQRALHGWIECSDGRLYHHVVAEKVLEAWIVRLKARRKGSTGNAKRWTAQIDLRGVDGALATAAFALSALKPDSRQLKGLPLGITQRLQEDRLAISHEGRKQEAIPPGYPSQIGNDLGREEGAAIPHTGAQARAAARSTVDNKPASPSAELEVAR